MAYSSTAGSMTDQALILYCQHLDGLDTNNDNINKPRKQQHLELESKTLEQLVKYPLNKRFPSMACEVINKSVQLEHFDANNAEKAFIYLEEIATNLIRFPWKKEFKKIKVTRHYSLLNLEQLQNLCSLI
jgi:hypothetical protein